MERFYEACKVLSVHRAAVIDLYKQEMDSVWKMEIGNLNLALKFDLIDKY